MNDIRDPHRESRLLHAGSPLSEAQAVMVMLHGRGATAENILTLAEEFAVPGVAYLAPQAAGYTWYPYSFLYPLEDNEPYLSSALKVVSRVIEKSGQSPEQIVLLGFSQGACLALEFAARHTQRYGGVIGLSGGLIGPEGMSRQDTGSLEGTSVFLGCSDPDPHIPVARVHYTTDILRKLGAEVTEQIYPHMGHTINQDEINSVKMLIQHVVKKIT